MCAYLDPKCQQRRGHGRNHRHHNNHDHDHDHDHRHHGRAGTTLSCILLSCTHSRQYLKRTAQQNVQDSKNGTLKT